MSDSNLKKKFKPRGGRQVKGRQELRKQQLLAESFLADKLLVHEIKEVVQPSGEIVNSPVNIRFVDPPPPREEDISTEIESPCEFDCLFSTVLNNAQQKLDRKKSRSNELETKIESITFFSDNEVEVIADIPIIRNPSDNGIDIEEEIWRETAQREMDYYSKSLSELENK